MIFALLACTSADPRVQLDVLAAASLTDAFSELETGFEQLHPDVDVALSFAGSQALATQIRHGIPADVFASADADHPQRLAGEGLLGAPRAFTGNTLVLALSPSADPADLASLPQVTRLVVGNDEVPVGRYTRALFDAAEARYGPAWRTAVEANIVSREPNVRLVLAKVAMGEADAAVVYATDVTDGVRAVPLPPELVQTVRYQHALVATTSQADLAGTWLAFVESDPGQAILQAHGFVAP